MVRVMAICIILLWAGVSLSQSARNRNPKKDKLKALTDSCLRCMCAASSECDPLVRCHTVFPDKYVCGPFQFDQSYWKAGGAPGSGDKMNPFAFEDCANDVYCSIEVIKKYMRKNIKDCDRNRKITCSDFALVHAGGKKGCTQKKIKDTTFWEKFAECSTTLSLG